MHVLLFHSSDHYVSSFGGLVQNSHYFKSWREGSRAATVFKMSFMMHCDFDMGSSKNQHNFFKLLLERGGQKRIFLCTLKLIMLTILDELLTFVYSTHAHSSN